MGETMPLLAIETSSRQLGIAVLEGEHLLSSFELVAEHPHAAELPEAVRRSLKAARLTLEQLEAIVVDIGPGSFTGLRIGLAFVKAMAFSLKKPVVGVASLDVLAANIPLAARPICPMLDAKQKNVYAALYQVEHAQVTRRTDPLLGPPADMLARISEPTIFLGDGAGLYREQIIQRLGDKALFATEDLWLPRAATLGRLGSARFLRGEQDDASRLVPLYLYPQDCSVRGPDRPTAVLPQAASTTSV